MVLRASSNSSTGVRGMHDGSAGHRKKPGFQQNWRERAQLIGWYLWMRSIMWGVSRRKVSQCIWKLRCGEEILFCFVCKSAKVGWWEFWGWSSLCSNQSNVLVLPAT